MARIQILEDYWRRYKTRIAWVTRSGRCIVGQNTNRDPEIHCPRSQSHSIGRQSICVSQEAVGQSSEASWSQRQLIQRRLIEDVIESIAVSISNVPSARWRVR